MNKLTFKSLLLFIIISIPFNINGQKKVEKKSITWQQDLKLTRNDFKGKIETNSTKIAQTGANIIIVPCAKKRGKHLYRVLAKILFL